MSGASAGEFFPGAYFNLLSRLPRAEDPFEDLSGNGSPVPFHLEAILSGRQLELSPPATRSPTRVLAAKQLLVDRPTPPLPGAGRDSDFPRWPADAVGADAVGPAA
jgi:hypothetical protein